ncbi:MAG: hypothetical protein KJS95_13365 [Gammaproteobacteria bacterium]|nr:hypothetical protein [Gammaproteobacteria bacterium]
MSSLEIVVDFFRELQRSGLLTVATVVFSISGGLFAFVYGLAAKRSERNLRILERQIGQFDGEMVNWGIRGIDALAKAHVFVMTECSGQSQKEAAIVRDDLQATLSALVDSGRLYFINRSPDLEGTERPYANRGFRPAILDALMLGHEELRRAGLPPFQNRERIAKNIFGARRVFIAELREEIDKFRDPKALSELRITDDDWSEVARLVNDYEDRHGQGSFWARRPMSRAELLAQKNAVAQPAAAAV